ncbi:MAG: hypothetical protein ACO25B_08925 [Chitinophagaceae bacterium]
MHRRVLFILFFLVLSVAAFTQQLAQIGFSGGSQLSHISLLTDREVLIRLSDDGRVIEWGIEVQSLRASNYYAPRLQPYPGRVEYYGSEADSISRGKLKSIGSSVITYYGAWETPEKAGKIRSVGYLQFDYFTHYDNKAFRGRVKSIGNLWLTYYSTFDNEALQGKLKSVGSTQITYYSSFDDKFIRGKIKSIGPVSYTWFTSLDRTGFGGGLKSGPMRQNTGGVVYIIL